MKTLPSQADRQKNFQLLALIAMASFGMLFGTFILSYLLARARMPVWPPIGVDRINLALPALSTGVLLASSIFLVWAGRELRAGRSGEFKKNWLLGTLCGFVFLLLQWTVLKQMWGLGLYLNSNLYTASLQFLILLHAVHVFIALLALWYISFVALKGKIGPQRTLSIQLVTWFWHFVDIVWIAMFLVFLL